MVQMQYDADAAVSENNCVMNAYNYSVNAGLRVSVQVLDASGNLQQTVFDDAVPAGCKFVGRFGYEGTISPISQ